MQKSRINPSIVFICCMFAAMLLSSCDVRSDTAKREMEKFTSSPTPPISAMPTPSPVDPADTVAADTSTESGSIPIDGYKKRTSVTCTKFDRVRVNGDENEVTVKGICRQIMINGDSNKVTIDAAIEFVFNGTENEVQYTRYLNGKQPVVTENRPGNIVQKASAKLPSRDSKSKIVK